MIASLFVNNPAVIFLVAGLFFGGYLLARRSTRTRQAKWLLLPAVAWTLWAAWELAIILYSPEADIRVELLLIIPLVLIASVAGIIMVFVPRKPAASA
jgi:hypothetical protein